MGFDGHCGGQAQELGKGRGRSPRWRYVVSWGRIVETAEQCLGVALPGVSQILEKHPSWGRGDSRSTPNQSGHTANVKPVLGQPPKELQAKQLSSRVRVVSTPLLECLWTVLRNHSKTFNPPMFAALPETTRVRGWPSQRCAVLARSSEWCACCGLSGLPSNRGYFR